MQTHSLRTGIPTWKAVRFILAAAVLMVVACAVNPAASEETGTDSHANPETLQSLVEALEERGASVERRDEVDQPFFSVPAVMLAVDGEDVQVFEYESEGMRRDESGKISADGRTIGTQSVHWIGNPRFWAQGRILVLYLGENEEVIGHLSSLLGSPIAHPEQRLRATPSLFGSVAQICPSSDSRGADPAPESSLFARESPGKWR